MAVLNPLYINAVDYNAEDERRGLSGLVAQSSPGVVRSGVLGAVPAVSLSGSTVQVGPFNGVVGTAKGGYLTGVDSVTSAGTLSPADQTNGRLDRVILEVLDPDNGTAGSDRGRRLRIVTGTPAALPGLPPLPVNSLHIAQIQVPRVGGGNPAVTVDCLLTAAAGAPVPVRNVAERGALSPRVGDQVARLDHGGAVQTWDGTSWDSAAAAPAVGSAWSMNGLMVKTRTPLGSLVSAGFMCTYPSGAGGFAINGTFKQAMTLNNPGFIPAGDVFGSLLVLSPGNITRADGTFNINPSGQIWIRTTGASYTIQPGDKFYISANWSA